jgi:glycosyltransferase involved in cell wall biosynthesis
VTVSVIIPTYNRCDSLKHSIDSVLAQTYTDYELIIVDDGSTDDTEIMVGGFDSPSIRYYKLRENKGAAAARNYGVQKATGNWVAFLDSDDEWLPEKLAQQVDTMRSANICVTGCFMTRFGQVHDYTPILKRPEDMMFGCRLNPGTTLMCDRNVLLDTPFDETLKRFEDWDWFIQQYLKGRSVHILSNVLAIVHLRPGKPADTLPALEALVRKYANLLPKNRGVIKAAAYVEKASWHMFEKKYIQALFYLVWAFILHPKGFYVVLPSLGRFLRR